MTQYEAGDTILEDEPYSAIVCSTSLETVCSYCFKNYVEYKCSLCNKLSYCSEKCQVSLTPLSNHRDSLCVVS